MKTPLFTGACTALVTPFASNEINLTVFDELLERQLEARIDALVICGTTGEAATVIDEERFLLISHAIQYVKGRCKVIAGTGSNNTANAVRLARIAQSYGADGILAVTPYYNKTTQEGIFAHYQAICGAVSIPVIAYNVPSRTGMSITLETYCRLAELNNLNGVKEASGDLPLLSRLARSCNLNIWSGCDELIVPSMSVGAKGVISTLANIVPKTVKQMCDACMVGNYAEAGNLQNDSMKLIDLLFSATNPLPAKAILSHLGIDVGDCRLPLYMSETERAAICTQVDQFFSAPEQKEE